MSITGNYITIQGWMVTNLNLKGNDLFSFALIYGFSQDEDSEFKGSINYICSWLNCSRPTAIKSLNYLAERDLIHKRKININNVSFNRYKVNLPLVKKLYQGSKETLPGVVKKLYQGSKETLPNNTINNTIKDINKDINIDFNVFWDLYDKKIGRSNCERLWLKLKDEDREVIIKTLPLFLKSITDKQFQPHPKTYLNQKRWEDEIAVKKDEPKKQNFITIF